MKIQAFIFNPFAENTYVVWDETSRHAAIIDPGCNSEREKSLLTDFIRNNNLEIKHLLNTHMHIDHSAGNAFIEPLRYRNIVPPSRRISCRTSHSASTDVWFPILKQGH